MVAQVPVKPKPFKLNAGDPVLDFVNTLDDRFSPQGPTELLTSYRDFLQFMQQAGMLGAKQAHNLLRAPKTEEALGEAVELREALARIFYRSAEGQPPLSRDLLRLSGYYQSASRHRRLCSVNSSVIWQWTDLQGELQAPVWMMAQGASELLVSDRMALLRACASESCRWLFLDTSKNHTRRWCDMKTCGNRMKARRFQTRQAIIEESG